MRSVKPSLYLGTLIICAYILLQCLRGNVSNFLLGEEYYIFAPAAVYPPLQAAFNYFLANGRLFETIYWTGLYTFLDFRPALFGAASLLLLYLSSLLAAIAIVRIWPGRPQRPQVALLILLLSFFSYHALNWVHVLSGDNARLANIFFWSSVLCLQKWVHSKFHTKWLLVGIMVFLVSLFTYESHAFSFPAILLLTVPLINPKELQSAKNSRVKQLLSLGTLSLFFILLPYLTYVVLSKLPNIWISHPAPAPIIAAWWSSLLNSLSVFWGYLWNFGNTDVSAWGWIGFLFLLATIGGSGLLLLHSRLRSLGSIENLDTLNWLWMASLWILFSGIAIRSLNGSVTVRGYTVAILSIPILLTLLHQLASGKLLRWFAIGLMVVWVGASIQEYDRKSTVTADKERFFNQQFIALQQLVPSVKSGTVFIFLDTGLGSLSGCGPALQILYQTQDLHCGFMGTTYDDRYEAYRHEDNQLNLEFWGGWIRDGNIILIGSEEERISSILPQLTPGDGLATVEWISTDPILTDWKRIMLSPPQPPSPMLRHIYGRENLSIEE